MERERKRDRETERDRDREKGEERESRREMFEKTMRCAHPIRTVAS